MGAGASTPGDSTKHVFSSDTPIQFSQELVDSLQASSETNSTRAKSLDLHIAQRVQEELEKIQKHESSRLEAIRNKISSTTDSLTPSSSSSSDTKSSSKSKASSLLELPSISASDLLPSALSGSSSESKEEKAKKDQSSKKVQAEIEKLKKALGDRKVVKDLPKEVDKARGDVIACLRMNDRQPLDCWKEVEIFKREVRKMEEQFVGKIL